MKTEFLVSPIALLAVLTAGGSSIARHGRPFVFHYENVLGTSLELKIDATNSAAADRADAAARREIERDARILSAWNSESEFSRWAATLDQPVRVSPELFETLSLFDDWRQRTGGVLDASAETVVRVWKNVERERREPSRAELAAAVDAVHHSH
jgi:FAD:protein FMN transferase